MLLCICTVVIVCGCQVKSISTVGEVDVKLDSTSLDVLYHSQNNPIGELLACGCEEGVDDHKIYTTIFYPVKGVTTYQLYMTDSIGKDKNDLREYHKVVVKVDSMFQGKLLRIDLEPPKRAVYSKVIGLGKDTIYVSDAIRVDLPMVSTPRSIDFVHVEQDTSTFAQLYQWNHVQFENPKAFLTLLSDTSGSVYSCAYTKRRNFVVDDLSTMDRVIYPRDPAKKNPGDLNLLWMCVNWDNWITHLCSRKIEVTAKPVK